MRRLPFVLPEFTRLAWVSDRARDVWEPRIRRISEAWNEIQWLSVAAGIRPCASIRMSEQAIARHTPVWKAMGVNAIGLKRESMGSRGYAVTAVPAKPGTPAVIRVGFGDQDHLARLRNAWNGQDHDEIGKLLGYPLCCCRFFSRTWVAESRIDTTWSMAVGAGQEDNDSSVLSVSGPPVANVLWRWVQVRAVPHLPCSFECAPTAALGEELLRLGEQVGFAKETGWCRQILSWPVEWSSLHGIAEIRTPILKIATSTDAVDTKCVVRRLGSGYPDEGASGIAFPYQIRKVPLGRTIAYRAGLKSPLSSVGGQPDWYHRDNGFSSRHAMELAHRRVLAVTAQALAGGEPAVLDLGCGNGALLRLLRAEAARELVPFGIDMVADRIEHARQLHPDRADNFVVGDIFDDTRLWQEGRRYRMVLLGAQRLSEVDRAAGQVLLRRIAEHAELLLLYGYDRATVGEMPSVLQRFGLMVDGEPETPAVLVKPAAMPAP